MALLNQFGGGNYSGKVKTLGQFNKKPGIAPQAPPWGPQYIEYRIDERSAPALKALLEQENWETPLVARRALADFQERGIGSGPFAEWNIKNILANLHGEYEAKRQAAKNVAYGQEWAKYEGEQNRQMKEREEKEKDKASKPWWAGV